MPINIGKKARFKLQMPIKKGKKLTETNDI